jgi:uncharacterized damage-inducible protein DinB
MEISMDLRQEMLSEFREELSTTRRVLDRVPEDKLAWQPHPKSMRLGQLAMHLATLPAIIAKMSRADSYDLATRIGEVPIPKDKSEVFTAFEQSVRDVESTFTETSEEDANAVWRLMRGEHEILSRSRFKVWRTFLLNHWYHHRGQLTVYLRMLDVQVPSVYGPSADERPF